MWKGCGEEKEFHPLGRQDHARRIRHLVRLKLRCVRGFLMEELKGKIHRILLHISTIRADEDFKWTAAHEFGHRILEKYGADGATF